MRVLIDCSGVRFRARPSGIPRVVLNYIEHSRAWGQQHGVEVLAVTSECQGGMAQAGMRPGSRLPGWRNLPWRQRVAIGTRFAIRQLCRETSQYLNGLVDASARLLCAVFKSRHVRPTIQTLQAALNRACRVPFWAGDGWYQRAIAIQPRPDDIVFMPAYWHDLEPDVITALSQRCRAVVVLVHDLLPVTHPLFYAHPWRDDFRDNTVHMLRTVSGVLTISRFTGAAVQTLADLHHIPVDLGLAYNGLDPLGAPSAMSLRPHVRALMTHPQGALLMVGTLEPKKGHQRVLDAMETLWAQGDQRPLVIVGRAGWMCESLIKRIRNSPQLGHRLFWLQDVGDEELAACYQAAQALVFMSDAEGFGLPMIEAASRGCPVVVTDALWSREVLGDVAHYVPAGDPSALVAVLRELPARKTQDPQFQWPGWDQLVPKVMDALLRHGRDATSLASLCPVDPPVRADVCPARGEAVHRA
jgi:glycosyltransferase involved in cell wall biosynthesis